MNLQKLVDTITKLNQVEADFLKHSEKFWECREDILRQIHESCHTVSRKVHIQIAGTERVMVGGDDFEQRLALATPSHERKRNNAGIDDDNGNHGEASVSVHHQSPAHEQSPILTEDYVNQGEVNESIKQPTTQERNPISAEDHVIQGEASESIKQSTAQEPKPMSTEKYDSHGILNERFEQHRQDHNERFEQHLQDLNERFKQHSQDVDIHGNGNKSIEHSTSTKDVDIHGNANKSSEHSTSTKDFDIHGDDKKSIEHSISTKDFDIHGDVIGPIRKQTEQERRDQISAKGDDIHGGANEPIEQQISTSTNDVDIHGDVNESVKQHIPPSTTTTKDHGSHGEAYVSIFGDGPLYPHCVETWEAANAKAQQMSRPDVTPTTNVRKFW